MGAGDRALDLDVLVGVAVRIDESGDVWVALEVGGPMTALGAVDGQLAVLQADPDDGRQDRAVAVLGGDHRAVGGAQQRLNAIIVQSGHEREHTSPEPPHAAFAAPVARKGWMRWPRARDSSWRGGPIPPSTRSSAPNALEFVCELHTEFEERRQELLRARVERRARLAEGEMLDFLPETENVRAGDWTVAPVPEALQQRWVEITGPTDRKMVINALNSGADGFMADFEDANSPTWRNMVAGPHQPARRHRRDDHLRRLRRAPLRAGGRSRHAAGPAAGLASARAPRPRRRRADVGGAVRLRDVLLSLGAAPDRLRAGAVLLSAQDGVPSGGAPVERRLLLRPGPRGHGARDDQGHRADRDAAGGV